MIKSICTVAAVCCVLAIGGCNNNKTNTTSPGAVGDKKSECSGSGSCCDKAKSGTSMGAVGEKKSGCCSGDAAKSGTSMGAVSDTKSGCCSGAKKN